MDIDFNSQSATGVEVILPCCGLQFKNYVKSKVKGEFEGHEQILKTHFYEKFLPSHVCGEKT